MLKIERLPLCRQAREHAHDLGGALGGEDRIGNLERFAVKATFGRAPGDVAGAKRLLEVRRDGNAGILAKRGDVVGGRADEQILEVEDADPAEAGAVREPEEVGRMVVEKDPILLDAGKLSGQLPPQLD